MALSCSKIHIFATLFRVEIMDIASWFEEPLLIGQVYLW